MTKRPIDFLVDLNGKAPRNLRDSIRKVGNASHGFRSSWKSGEHQYAFETSQEAFAELDYIQNELLRQRDAAKNLANWAGSPLDSALQVAVGRICSPLSAPDESWFQNLTPGQGALPSTTPNSVLTLGMSLNKLKHRTTSVVNFALPATGGHMLYVLTEAGMGQPATLCEIDIDLFCTCCGSAANHV
ncbi:hypothetical protein SAMN05192555_1197 [Franzmannia pantelleriensis]|uniref:Uncharacterized protein n=1 Tax=Franzmannia pantelleriensis TaxID=48727 RepID=A0A1G9VV65_9GAMM|nr:hypothetical protein SAMN05192555_1197 [Halomonas pantelleriensis]